jgi:hypothetical protein
MAYTANLAPATSPAPIPAGADAVLAGHATAIRRLGKQTVENAIEIGDRLTKCQKLVGHGGWLLWLDREFGWSDRTALNFMRLAELAKSETVSDLKLSMRALYLLAAPSTPTEVRDEIVERARAGETIPVAEVKRVIDRAKTKPGRTKTKTKTKTSKTNKSMERAARQAEWDKAEIDRIRAQGAELDTIRRIESEKWRLEAENAVLKNEIAELKVSLGVRGQRTNTAGESPEEYWQRSLIGMADEVAVRPTYWPENWRSFAVSQVLLESAARASVAWADLVIQLSKQVAFTIDDGIPTILPRAPSPTSTSPATSANAIPRS